MLATTLLASAQDRLVPRAVLCGIPRADAVIHVGAPTNGRAGRDPRLPRPVCGTRLTRCKAMDATFVLGQHSSGRRVCRRCAGRTGLTTARPARPALDTFDGQRARFAGMTADEIRVSVQMATTVDELRACSLAIDVLGGVGREMTGSITYRIDELQGFPARTARDTRNAETRHLYQDEMRARARERHDRKRRAITAFAL